MPFSTKFPLTEIMDAMQYWYEKTGNRITLNIAFGKELMMVMKI
jgi:23S rRNA (adenine2503-C2)-methyltransferase